jgi:hypothetical protein
MKCSGAGCHSYRHACEVNALLKALIQRSYSSMLSKFDQCKCGFNYSINYSAGKKCMCCSEVFV